MVELLENRQFLSANFFTQHNLVSDGAVPADRIDKNLKNPWGLASDVPGPLWVANNGTNTATIYDFDTGKPAPLIVHTRGHGGGDENPTGEVYNIAEGNFDVKKNGKSDSAKFIFAGEDGTISGWSPGVDLNNTVLAVDNSSKGAVYKGLAEASWHGKFYIYATDFVNRHVEVYNESFHKVTHVGTFIDPTVPRSFNPFGIQQIDGKIYVTYAKKVPGEKDEAHGAGLGYVSVFRADGKLLGSFRHTQMLDAPWGVAKAPASWGKYANDILVGNFGSGKIVAFNASGQSQGTLNSANGKPVVNDGLWGLRFGNDKATDETLFISAGINGEADGLLANLKFHAK
jgi:uncharacterized protein (TIGR03118 family)